MLVVRRSAVVKLKVNLGNICFQKCLKEVSVNGNEINRNFHEQCLKELNYY